MTLLAVIPARGNSRGIPQKALQLVAGVPLLLHTMDRIEESGVADRIVVTTDCPQIKGFCELRGIEVIDRPAELAEPHVPLAPVIAHSVTVLDWTGTVAVFQPTCPLLTADTIRHVVDQFEANTHHWSITGSEDPHTYWSPASEGLSMMPLTARVNRQHRADALTRETGAIQIMHASAVHGTDHRGVIQIPASEALDIDTPADLQVARQTLEAVTIQFCVTMSPRVGTGHYWRCLQLADTLATRGHKVGWSWASDATPPAWALDTIWSRGYRHDMPRFADVCVVDALHASRQWVLTMQASGSRVVVFEDDGPGADKADLVFNEMVDGPKWAILRPEFTCLPDYEVDDDVVSGHVAPNVLVTFGGTDPAGLTDRVFTEIAISAGDVRCVRPEMNVHMAQEMQHADLVITGQGRTVFEAAACGVPCLSIAANEREARHVRIPGVIYLGLHTLVSDQQLRETVQNILQDRALREDMSDTARDQIDDKGLARIVRRIEDLAAGL